jgi:hypothetical protein
MPAPTNVRLLLKGLLVLTAKEGQPTGKVGILKTSPAGHDLTIVIRKIPPAGPSPPARTINRPQINDALSLNVVSAEPNITIRNKNPVNRNAPPANRDSINWFVDLERPAELYRFPVGVNSEEFRPVLTFNSGQLFTFALSETPLLVQKGIFASYQTFGVVAITLGIDFLTTVQTVFKNGAETVFDSATEPGTDYVVTITNDAAVHPGGPITDANNYYRALGTGIPLEQRFLFMSIRPPAPAPVGGAPLPPVGPEAACFPAYLGQSELG